MLLKTQNAAGILQIKHQWYEKRTPKIDGYFKATGNPRSQNRVLCILTECCDNDLDGYLKQSVTNAQFLTILYDIAEGLETLHRMGVIPRDIKQANIFVKDGRGKVGDLGIAIYVKDVSRLSLVGSPYYMAPEMSTGQYSTPSDIYAFGVTMRDLVSYSAVFGSPKVPSAKPLLSGLISEMTRSSPRARPTASQVK